jgi:hypothetical protein
MAASAIILLLVAGQSDAARIRYHYVPTGTGTSDDAGVAQSGGGERLTWRLEWQPCDQPAPRATHLVTFCHPASGKLLTLPLGLPEGTPQMVHSRNRVTYDYGTYTVDVHFLSDGSADVIYQSGLLVRPP